MLRVHGARMIARLALPAVVAAGLVTVAGMPARASYVTISVSRTTTLPGSTVRVSATTDLSTYSNSFVIFDAETGAFVASCSGPSPTTCSGDVTEYLPRSRTFRATVRNGSTILAQSSDVTVTWRIGTCGDVPQPVEICTTQGAEIERLSLYFGTVPPGGTSYRVAGYVDVYRKTVGATTVSIPCVVLVADTTDVDPCSLLGATFVSRTATLVDSVVGYGSPGAGVAYLSAAICDVTLTVLVGGIGVNSTPVVMLC